MKAMREELTMGGWSVKRLRLTVKKWDEEFLYGTFAGNGCEQIIVCYASAERPHFSGLYHQLYVGAEVNLLDSQVCVDDQRGERVYYPTYVVLSPDFLLDISALSACVQYQGSHPLNYFLHKFQPAPQSPHILLGNAANQFMDDCVNHADEVCSDEEVLALYRHSIEKNFRDYLLEYVLSPDSQIGSAFFEQAKLHFSHVWHAVEEKFESSAIGIARKGIRLEPSFFCEALGLQGRMDVLTDDLTRIVELKSGKADCYGGHVVRAKEEHILQMALYKEVLYYNLDVPHEQVKSYLLYSRYPAMFEEEVSQETLQRAVALRNGIMHYERVLQQGGARELVNSLTIDLFNEKQRDDFFYHNYIAPRIATTLATLQGAEGLTADYFYAFLSFLSREQQLAKVGNGVVGDGVGFAEVWNASAEEKQANGALLIDLQPMLLELSGEAVLERIVFKLPTYEEGFLPNFRKGDVVLFYRRNQLGENVTNQQVFRGAIEQIDTRQVTVLLRNKQRSSGLFEADSRYAIEPDYMDSSFSHGYRGLYAFLQVNERRRALILGTRPPEFDPDCSLNNEVDRVALREIVSRAKSAKDYFLLVGPPGTGKTSVALKLMVQEFLSSGKQILLLAYTNQAVDEICGMLEGLSSDVNYIRVGQELNCNSAYTSRLLKYATQSSSRRSEVRKLLLDTPIFVSTVASITGKLELLRFKRFDVALIDEASQILEPQLLPLLCAQHEDGEVALPKFILIGDHKQLPAVVVQTEEESEVDCAELAQVALSNCRNSLFERLYLLNAHSEAVASLTQQGRMHDVVSDFVNTHYYEASLSAIPLAHQRGKLPYVEFSSDSWARFVATTRLGFIEVTPPGLTGNAKANVNEAAQVARLVASLVSLYAQNQMPLALAGDVGIIVPFRNQIAMVQQALAGLGIAGVEAITIDTVERYQGSQRDVIIFCTTVRNEAQLEILSAPILTSGISLDRKLNVALTRARKQLFVLGNSKLLKGASAYDQLIHYIKTSSGDEVGYFDLFE